jgi:prevent-host-death family protein
MDATVASRELRNSTRELLERVAAGEEITITVRGRPTAVLRPVHDRPRWVARDDFLARFADRQADSGLREELTALAPDTTEDLQR